MSRIGNNPISIPEGVNIDIQSNKIVVKGKLGELTQDYSDVTFELKDNILIVKRPSDSKDHRAKHGLYRSLVNNMVEGVSVGFTKELELVGVGYRASNQGQKLDLALGFSHNILFEIAPEVKVETLSEKGKNPSLNYPHMINSCWVMCSKNSIIQKTRTLQRKRSEVCRRTN